MREYTIELKRLLEEAVRKNCEAEVGIVFSGGIDSTIIGMLASNFSKVTAYACGIEGSPDLDYAKDCRNLGFDIEYIELNEELIENALKKIIPAINDRNPVKVAVEVPFYYASKKAREDNLCVMLCGQGADELFGGYNRYLEGIKAGHKAAEDMMQYDIENMYEQQLNKDIAVCKSNDIVLRSPYMEQKFIEYAKKIPVEWRIRESEEFGCVDEINGKGFIRKYILRKLGEDLGVPKPILNRRKKAAQYGSGTQKIIKKIARQKGFKKKANTEGRNDYVRLFLEEL